MLTELTIQDFAIITNLHLRFGKGFNVLTGETGAGKSIILDAVTLILGGRADTTFVRAGCEKAIVEAIFEIDEKVQQAIAPLLEEEALDDGPADTLIISREIRSNGRNICRINGSTAKISLLRDIGEHLIGIHGQGEHLALLSPRSHLPLLDAYANIEDERKAFAAEVHTLRGLERERDELRQNERTRQQRLDMLKFQAEEIGAADLRIGEEEELKSERTRLANMEQLVQNSTEALAIISGFDDGETPSISDMLSQAEASISVLAKLDDTQKELLARIQGLVSEFDELSADLRGYNDDLEHDPQRLSFLEERIELINRLKRKYGDSISEILEVHDRAIKEMDSLEHSEERIGTLNKEIDQYLRKIGQLAQRLSEKRQAAAKKLAKTIETELGDLKMTARFGVDFTHQPADPAESGAYVGHERLNFDHTGIDRLEFLISANPGEPLKPMAKVASGGETARLMLALKTALAQVDTTPTLIFDEIDQGIGGRIGSVVGQKLWSLTSHAKHQVIVVTHLPQMAGFGDTHFHVSKQISNGRTSTAVIELDHHQRIDELGAMLGTKEDLGRVGARSLLEEARVIKEKA